MFSKFVNMINIQDVTVPTKGVGKYFQITALNFVVSPTSGIQTYWQVFLKPKTKKEIKSQALC
jgi:hypothetical protein